MSTTETIVIVGAGLAGVTAAGALRDSGFNGRLVLLSEEPELPYDRPPLSKSVLVHDDYESLVAAHLPGDIALKSPAQIALRSPQWYEEHRIELLLGCRAAALETGAHRVQLENGEWLGYDRLLLAPGARVRRLESMERGAAPHFYLRTLGDALRLRAHLTPGRKVVLLGGGVIGMEVAASAILRDCDVTVVEAASNIMARALPSSVSEHLAAYHRSKGVKLRLSMQASSQANGETSGVVLADGSIVDADLIVIGIGVVPNVELARAAGLRCTDGIVVDEFGLSSAPDVYAAGDAVNYPDSFFGRSLRSENWMHAQNQALSVARNMLGTREPYRQIPQMWSDQYDLKIQTAGNCSAPESVVRGDPQQNKFMVLHLDNRCVTGVTGINQARDVKYAHSLIEARAAIDPQQLADPTFNLKKAATNL